MQLWPFATSSRMELRSILLLVANSWWWAERLLETCRVVIPIKLKFSASAGFIHNESVTMHGHTIVKNYKQNSLNTSWYCLLIHILLLFYILRSLFRSFWTTYWYMIAVLFYLKVMNIFFYIHFLSSFNFRTAAYNDASSSLKNFLLFSILSGNYSQIKVIIFVSCRLSKLYCYMRTQTWHKVVLYTSVISVTLCHTVLREAEAGVVSDVTFFLHILTRST
jgi:hypothetical protein